MLKDQCLVVLALLLCESMYSIIQVITLSTLLDVQRRDVNSYTSKTVIEMATVRYLRLKLIRHELSA